VTTPDQENELHALLRRRAESVEVPGDFAPVAMARRRRDQRNRAVVGAAAAAAVIAVTMPAVWSANRGTPPPVAAVTTSTTSIPSPSSSVTTRAPSTTPVATRADAYALDDTIRFGDTVLRLEKGTVVESLAVLAGGGFVIQSHLSTGSSQSEMEILSPTGRTVRALGPSGMYVVSPDGSRVLAKSGASNTAVVYAADGTVVSKRQDQREVAALVDDVAYLNGDAASGSLAWNVSTGATRRLPGHLVAVSPDRTRGALQWFVATDAMDEACWAVIDLTKPTFPTTVKKCGGGQNPTMFMPMSFSSKGTYLVGSNYVDGGFWFSAGLARVSDGAVVLGGDGDPLVSGWSWHLDDDESTFVISRNTSRPVSPATSNTLQRCTLTMDCVDVQPQVQVRNAGGAIDPRYVVPR
jgi:hypothetical protein